MTVDEIIQGIIQREKGYVNRADDRGGPTNWGITIKTLSEWLGRPATIDEVKALTPEVASQIYLAKYVQQPKFDQLTDSRLRELAIDTGVNHGQARAAKWLQETLIRHYSAPITADGVIGPKTLAAANDAPARELFARYLNRRIAGYADFVQHSPDQLANLEGWNDRAGSFILRLV